MHSLAIFLYWRKDEMKYFKFCNKGFYKDFEATNVFERLRQPVSVWTFTSAGKQFRFFHSNLDIDKVPGIRTHLPFFCSQASNQPLILFQMWLNNEKYFSYPSLEFLGFFFPQKFFLRWFLSWDVTFDQMRKQKAKIYFTCKKIPSRIENNSSNLQSFTLLPMWNVCTAFWTLLFLQQRQDCYCENMENWIHFCSELYCTQQVFLMQNVKFYPKVCLDPNRTIEVKRLCHFQVSYWL